MDTRVLFADDQLPYDDQESNDAVKIAIFEEIEEKLKKEGKDPEKAYAEDFKWFLGLLQHMNDRFVVKTVRRFEKAEIEAQKRDDYDVAVIDLSWSGDDRIPLGKRKNKGLEILKTIHKENESGKRGYKPIIAFSQNYKDDPELMSLVLDAGALPVPKNYTPLGYSSISSAITYLVNLRPPNTKNVPSSEVAVAMVNRSSAIITAVVVAAFGFMGVIATAILANKPSQSSEPAAEETSSSDQSGDGAQSDN